MENITYDSWDSYDEDYYPAGDDYELEYEEEFEEDDEPYEHQYSPVQGSWDPTEYDEDFYYGTKKVIKKVRSVKTVELAKEKERKHWEKKRRMQSQAREKQRQAYYHYGNEDKEDDE